MKSRKNTFTIILLLLTALAATACGGASDAAPTETPTPTPEILGSGSGSDNSDNPETPEEPAAPTDTPEEPTPTPEAEFDSCLIGTWGIDKEAFADYMYQSMNQTEGVEFTFTELEGDFEMVIEEGVLSYTSTEPLTIKLSMVASGITLTTLDMIVVGQGSANWLTYENYFIQYGQDYDFFGDGLADTINSDMVGQTEVTVTLDPAMFVSMAKIQNPEFTAGLILPSGIQNYAAATYTCEGDTFTYQFDEYVAIWHRK